MSSRGINRERRVKDWLISEDYWVCRAAGSFGDADLVALKAGAPTLMIEVKSDAAGPFDHFRPKDRLELLAAAELAGARALLVWWPPRGQRHLFWPEDWPGVRGAAA